MKRFSWILVFVFLLALSLSASADRGDKGRDRGGDRGGRGHIEHKKGGHAVKHHQAPPVRHDNHTQYRHPQRSECRDFDFRDSRLRSEYRYDSDHHSHNDAAISIGIGLVNGLGAIGETVGGGYYPNSWDYTPYPTQGRVEVERVYVSEKRYTKREVVGYYYDSRGHRHTEYQRYEVVVPAHYHEKTYEWRWSSSGRMTRNYVGKAHCFICR